MPADPKLQQVAQAICTARKLTLGPEVGAGAFKLTFEVRAAESKDRSFACSIVTVTSADGCPCKTFVACCGADWSAPD
jgi:hypothetical protein